MNFYILTVYHGEENSEEKYCGVFSTYGRAVEYASDHAKCTVGFRATPAVLDQWKDETDTYYIDKVPEGYNIKS